MTGQHLEVRNLGRGNWVAFMMLQGGHGTSKREAVLDLADTLHGKGKKIEARNLRAAANDPAKLENLEELWNTEAWFANAKPATVTLRAEAGSFVDPDAPGVQLRRDFRAEAASPEEFDEMAARHFVENNRRSHGITNPEQALADIRDAREFLALAHAAEGLEGFQGSTDLFFWLGKARREARERAAGLNP